MSVSQTILNYINALKWPVVVGAGVYYFRKPFGNILERISTAQKGAITGPAGTGVSWDNTLRQVEGALDRGEGRGPH